MKKLTFLVAFLSLTASNICWANTKAELVIPADKKQVIDALTTMMLSKNFAIKTVNDYQAEFFKQVEDWRIRAVYGDQQSRVSYNLTDTKEGVKVIANMYLVDKPGTAFEQVRDLSFDGPAKQDALAALNQVKASLV